MKELLVGLAVGMAAGFAIGVSDCGQTLTCKAKCKLVKLCRCAENEIEKAEKSIDACNCGCTDKNEQKD